MVSIHKCKRNVETTLEQLEAYLEYLEQNGVILYYVIHENHGHYNQLHTHAIGKYTGRYKKLSKIKRDGQWYAAHWRQIDDIGGAVGYLEKTPNHLVSVRSRAL